MDLEGTAVHLGGNVISWKPYWCDFWARFGHFVGDVEQSREMVVHVEAILQILFGHFGEYVLAIRSEATFWA